MYEVNVSQSWLKDLLDPPPRAFASRQSKRKTAVRKNPSFQSGIFNPRIVAAFVLVTFGISLGVFSFAGPKSAARKSNAQTAAAFQPTIIQSIFNGVSSPVREMPVSVTEKQSGEPEHDLPRVKPARSIPVGFVDTAVHPLAAISAAPG